MGPELGEDGWVKNPVRVDWKAGGTFVTPPGWWHSHHNDSDEDAWVSLILWNILVSLL